MGDLNTSLTAVSDLLLGVAGQPWVYAGAVIACVIDGFFPQFPSETTVVGLTSLARVSWLAFGPGTFVLVGRGFPGP